MPVNKLARYGLAHNPFSPLAPIHDSTRRAVFTSYEGHLDYILTCLLSGRACCIFGTYGMGKTFLMLESRARLQREHAEVTPIYERALTGQVFELTVLDGLYHHAAVTRTGEGNGVQNGLWQGIEVEVANARAGKSDPMRVARNIIAYFHERKQIPVLLIDDVDRLHGVERLKAVVDTSRELLALGCSVALPGNPDNPTRIIKTVGQGIFDPVILKPLSELQFKLMVSRYLATARTSAAGGSYAGPNESLVFICYAEEDRQHAELLHGKIGTLGYRPWIASKDILPGENWREAIDRAIRSSIFFLACISKNSVAKRGFVQSELKAALDRARELLAGDIYIIPILLDDSTLPEGVAMLQAADSRGNDFLRRLDASFKRGWELRNPSAIHGPEAMIDLSPFEEKAITYILARIGDVITPRMLITACSGFLNLAADEKCESVGAEFVEKNWSYIGANTLANEAELDSLISILLEMAQRNGEIDEEVDLATLRRILVSSSGRFADLVKAVEKFEDIVTVQDGDGLMKVVLSPFISPDFLSGVFGKMTLDDFRRRFRSDNLTLAVRRNNGPGDDDPAGGAVLLERF